MKTDKDILFSYKPIISIVEAADNSSSAYEKVKNLFGVPTEVAQSFFNLYAGSVAIDQKQAFEAFYNEVKQTKA